MRKVHIGDGVYVSFLPSPDEYQIELTTDDTEDLADTIYLPFEVFLVLVKYVKKFELDVEDFE